MGRGEYFKNKYGGGRRGGRGGSRGGGRGEYYRNKYGGGGRGGGRGGRGASGDRDQWRSGRTQQVQSATQQLQSSEALASTLLSINQRPYGAYKDIYGSFLFGGGNLGEFTLTIDRVQSDPYAPPSRMHIVMPPTSAQFPEDLYQSKVRKVALCDYLTRTFHYNANMFGADRRTESGGYHGAKGGEIIIDKPGQHVLERTSVQIHPSGAVEARFTIALPARGRSICGDWAATILTETLPRLARQSLTASALDINQLTCHILSVEDQDYLRSQLRELGLVGFVKNGAILPRITGNSDAPMDQSTAIPFQSPLSMKVEVAVPNAGTISGMGIRPGVNLVVGGGFHGKSTLLQALEVGVYNHIPGDGREFVVVDPTSVKIRAEDGRCVKSVNISPFIDNLPFGKNTVSFSTDDASGSTSQAANIVEALEAGSKTLLVDEDTCATNFMIRDARMQMLVSKDKEPITPFISKVRAMYENLGVSAILVIGGAGDYFEVADSVIMMDCYSPQDVTERAKEIASNNRSGSLIISEYGTISHRTPEAASFLCEGKIAARGVGKLQYGESDIDLSSVEQLVELSQTRAIGDVMKYLATNKMSTNRTFKELLDDLDADFDANGLDILNAQEFIGNYARPRRFEVAAALNRFRNSEVIGLV